MKKGQIIGQVFVLMLASIIFILILVYGYRAIGQFSQRSEQVALLDFENDLKNGVKGISLDFGSVKRLDLSVPRKHRTICVFCSPDFEADWDGCKRNTAFGIFAADHRLFTETWEDGSQNVFLLPLAETPIIVDRVEVKDMAFCTPVIEGKVSFKLEGKGDRTLVSPWPR